MRGARVPAPPEARRGTMNVWLPERVARRRPRSVKDAESVPASSAAIRAGGASGDGCAARRSAVDQGAGLALSSETSTRRTPGRPTAGGRDSATRLAWLFMLLVLVGLTVGHLTVQLVLPDVSLGPHVSGALGLNPPKRIRSGYAPAAPPEPVPDRADAGVASTDQTSVEARSVPREQAPGAAPSSPRIAELHAGTPARVVNTDNLGVVLRAAPRTDARLPRGLLEGARVTVLERAGDEWARVRGENGVEGWVPVRYLARLG